MRHALPIAVVLTLAAIAQADTQHDIDMAWAAYSVQDPRCDTLEIQAYVYHGTGLITEAQRDQALSLIAGARSDLAPACPYPVTHDDWWAPGADWELRKAQGYLDTQQQTLAETFLGQGTDGIADAKAKLDQVENSIFP